MNLLALTSTLFFFFESINTAYAASSTDYTTITSLSLPKADLLRDFLGNDFYDDEETVDVAIVMFYILQSFTPIDLKPNLFRFITRNRSRIFDYFFFMKFSNNIYPRFLNSLTPELREKYNIPSDVSDQIDPRDISFGNMDDYPVLRAFYDLFIEKFNSEFAKEAEQFKILLNTNDHHEFNLVLQTNDSVEFIVHDLRNDQFNDNEVLDKELEEISELIISRFQDEQDKSVLKKDVTCTTKRIQEEISNETTLVKFAVFRAKRFLNHFKEKFCREILRNPSFLFPSTY